MRILGIDPGLTHTGWGLVEYKNNTPRHIANGTISTQPKQNMADRLAHIMQELQKVIFPLMRKARAAKARLARAEVDQNASGVSDADASD